jgi:toxin ParE1/3/4
MKIVWRAEIARDVEIASNYYANEGGSALELRFVDALEAGVIVISKNPRAGLDWIGKKINRPGLRHYALKHFPYYLFYWQSPTQIELWRLLHRRRDLPARLQD